MKTAFAIRQKSTGKFLPPAPGRGGTRGFTHVKPSDEFPRLFHRRQDAQVALSWWLKGKLTVSWIETDNPNFGPDMYEDWHTEQTPERQGNDMEIVEIELAIK